MAVLVIVIGNGMIDATLDPVFDCLARYERRLVLDRLAASGGSAPVEALASALTDHEAERADGAPPVARNQASTALRERHLPKLAGNGIVEREDDHVRLCDRTPVDVVELVRSRRDSAGFEDATPCGARPVATRQEHHSGQDRTLTDAIVDAIIAHRGDDLLRTDFEVYDDVDFRALDELFRDDATPRTRVALTTQNVRVDLWGDGGVQIRVTDACVE